MEDQGLFEIESVNYEGTGYSIPEDEEGLEGEAMFTETTMLAFEAVRAEGMCNMMDRFCVNDAVQELPIQSGYLVAVCEDKKLYPKFLVAFGAWKQAKAAV